MLNRIVRLVLTLGGLGAGFSVSFYSIHPLEKLLEIQLRGVEMLTLVSLGTLVGGLLGFFVAPIVARQIWQLTSWTEGRLQKMPMQDLLSGAVGLIVGLIIANLLGSAFSRIPGLSIITPTLGSLLFGYLGLSVGLKKREELAGLLTSFPRIGGKDKPAKEEPRAKILDTSVIIDGRIADIFGTGFIEGPVVIPGFVLEELRHIADSSDVLKRNRGRRGLDILNKIQKELKVQVQIYERDLGGNLEVDSKLVRLAKILNGKVITNDYNLNKVAELQGVPVLNINELANAVKPIVLPGEEMVVHVIKDGKEAGQGVAYLDDGTMIVVDGGRRHIGETIGVMVTSVLQTAAGRMIFAKPKHMEKAIP